MVPFFGGDKECTKNTYSEQQIKDKMMAYIKAEQLQEKKNIKLNPFLATFFPLHAEEEEVQEEKKPEEKTEENAGEDNEEDEGKKKKRGKKT